MSNAQTIQGQRPRRSTDYDPAAFQGIHARYVLVIDIDPDDDKLAAQLGSIKWAIDSHGRASRSNRKTTYASEACRPRIGQTRWP
jgi:hypothetical protein